MSDPFKQRRREVAGDARSYLAGELGWESFVERYSGHDFETDSDIGELVFLIEHEPSRSGFGGVDDLAWRKYSDQLDSAIRKLES